MARLTDKEQKEAAFASESPEEFNKEEYTILLSPEGQARLVDIIENPSDKTPSEAMLRAVERRVRNSGTPRKFS